MPRVIIHAWFPHLAAERVRRTAGAVSDLPPPDILATLPLVLTSACHGADLVDSVCRLAWRQGLRPGMRLADARALRPALPTSSSSGFMPVAPPRSCWSPPALPQNRGGQIRASEADEVPEWVVTPASEPVTAVRPASRPSLPLVRTLNSFFCPFA